ncbi:hypothetical protein MWN33_09480 [Starkeya koreensis]|uniref:Uncharacterized protein n=1 Tax=Ancylobacter koreensis TaxID=266121 RepID=A0ABT0DLV2_9HYPH|nr:hypothetical protein [Ancylobacter koreensis]MCK0208261.1 hypothetical protein [Ancylobacter koreensis]
MSDVNEVARSGIDDTTRFLIYPAAIYVLQQLFTGFFKLRGALRERSVLVTGLIDEIKSIQKTNSSHRVTFSNAVSTNLFAKRIEESATYYPYISIGDGKNIVFDGNAERLPFFLNPDAFNKVVEFYDTYALLIASLKGMHNSAFKELSAERKLNALRNISDVFEELFSQMPALLDILENEHRRLTSRSVLWHLTGLSLRW